MIIFVSIDKHEALIPCSESSRTRNSHLDHLPIKLTTEVLNMDTAALGLDVEPLAICLEMLIFPPSWQLKALISSLGGSRTRNSHFGHLSGHDDFPIKLTTTEVIMDSAALGPDVELLAICLILSGKPLAICLEVVIFLSSCSLQAALMNSLGSSRTRYLGLGDLTDWR